jgi:hypothetical protein
MLHYALGGVFVPCLNFEEPKAGKGDNAGKKMAFDLVVGPMKHRINSDMTDGLAHPELLLDSISVK